MILTLLKRALFAVKKSKSWQVNALAAFCALLIVTGIFFYVKSPNASTEKKSPHIRWSMEVFDKIKSSYWRTVTDADLGNLFELAAEKVSGKPAEPAPKTRAEVEAMIEKKLAGQTVADQKKFITTLAAVVLYNLPPAGRNALYTSRDETALRNEVKNVDTGKDLYATVGLTKGASTAEVEKSYTEQAIALKKENAPNVKQKLDELSYAKKVLTTPDTKANYDSAKIEPTVFAKTMSPEVYYIYIDKFSPTTFDEFVRTANASDGHGKLKALILDIRGNIGGAVDILPYFLGLFIGQNEYAYDFFHQDNYEPNKTKTPKLPSLAKFKHMAVLTDGLTQSSAEVMTTTFKRYNKAVVVGKTTRGWGTIENTFPIETVIDSSEKYSLFMVHRLTVRDDGEPVEGHGVEPNVDITKSDWRTSITDYIGYQPLLGAVKAAISTEPSR